LHRDDKTEEGGQQKFNKPHEVLAEAIPTRGAEMRNTSRAKNYEI
jgi:hypothetical protein